VPVPFGAGAMSLIDRSGAGNSVDTISNLGLVKARPRKFNMVWRNVDGSVKPVITSPTEDSIAAFKDRFSALSREQQEGIYDFSLQVARKFCKGVLESRETLIEGNEEIFGFPFARIPLFDFDSLNSIWEFMGNTLGKAEGPRFVIDSDLDVFVFGKAKCYSFKTSPVTHFTEVFASRVSSNSNVSKANAFVLHGRDEVFYVDGDLKSAYLKMRQSAFAVPLWKLAKFPAAGISFEENVKGFKRFQVLSHEYGHVLSFKDELVANMILNPIFDHDGQEYVHPSYSRFHDMGEVYAELFGFIDALIEKRNDVFTILAFAYYARTLMSPRKNGRTRAFALINLFLRNVHFDRDSIVDYDGLRRDVDAQKAFFYDQFEMYKSLTDDEIKMWVNGGMAMAVMIRGLQKAMGIKTDYGSLGKPPVEAIFRNQLIESLGLDIRINRGNVHVELRKLRKRLWSWAHTISYDRDVMERNITSKLPGLVNEILTNQVGFALDGYILETLGLRERYVHPHGRSIEIESVPSYVNDVNKLIRIQSMLDHHEISSHQELEDYAVDVRTIKVKYPQDADIGKLSIEILNQISKGMHT
jgi:hypothetical protein